MRLNDFKHDLEPKSLEFSTFDIIKRRKLVTLFKLGKLRVFKYFFDDKGTFKALAKSYNEDKCRFEFKTFRERNKALKILERNGFDYDLTEDLRLPWLSWTGSQNTLRF